MSILDLSNMNIKDTADPIVINADSEIEVRILEVKMDTDKNGNPYILPRFEVVGEPLAKDFTKFLSIPTQKLDPKKFENAKRSLKNFGLCFDIDFDIKQDVNDMVGKTGWVIVGVETTDEYGEQNYIKKFVRN